MYESLSLEEIDPVNDTKTNFPKCGNPNYGNSKK
jgi:hypothetical protein